MSLKILSNMHCALTKSVNLTQRIKYETGKWEENMLVLVVATSKLNYVIYYIIINFIKETELVCSFEESLLSLVIPLAMS